MVTTTATDETIASIGQAITYASELFTRLDNGESLRPWEVLEGKSWTIEADSALLAWSPNEECQFIGSALAGELKSSDCVWTIHDLREQLAQAKDDKDFAERHAQEAIDDLQGDFDRLTDEHKQCKVGKVGTKRIVELEAENAALREMLALYRERSDFLVAALHRPRGR